MAKAKLEVGKKYVTRNGKIAVVVAGILYLCDCFRVDIYDDGVVYEGQYSYHGDGSIIDGQPYDTRDLDLSEAVKLSANTARISKDKTYRTRAGNEVTILRDDLKHHTYTVAAILEQNGREVIASYTSTGVFLEHSVSPEDLIESKCTYEGLKIDDKVTGESTHGYQLKGHFAGMTDEGPPTVWCYGGTSFSQTGRDVMKSVLPYAAE